jgi:hypothetical protein
MKIHKYSILQRYDIISLLYIYILYYVYFIHKWLYRLVENKITIENIVDVLMFGERLILDVLICTQMTVGVLQCPPRWLYRTRLPPSYTPSYSAAAAARKHVKSMVKGSAGVRAQGVYRAYNTAALYTEESGVR